MEEARAWLRSYAIQLYEREEGKAADWPVIAQGLFAAAFSIIDEARGDGRARSVLRRVDASVYDRLAGNEGDGLPPPLSTGPTAAPDPVRAPRLPEQRLKPLAGDQKEAFAGIVAPCPMEGPWMASVEFRTLSST